MNNYTPPFFYMICGRGLCPIFLNGLITVKHRHSIKIGKHIILPKRKPSFRGLADGILDSDVVNKPSQ